MDMEDPELEAVYPSYLQLKINRALGERFKLACLNLGGVKQLTVLEALVAEFVRAAEKDVGAAAAAHAERSAVLRDFQQELDGEDS